MVCSLTSLLESLLQLQDIPESCQVLLILYLWSPNFSQYCHWALNYSPIEQLEGWELKAILWHFPVSKSYGWNSDPNLEVFLWSFSSPLTWGCHWISLPVHCSLQDMVWQKLCETTSYWFLASVLIYIEPPGLKASPLVFLLERTCLPVLLQHLGSKCASWGSPLGISLHNKQVSKLTCFPFSGR